MSSSNYLENRLFDAALRNTTFTAGATVYVALHTADPAETGANEVSGSGYSRQAAAFGAPSNGVGSNSGTITVPLPTGGGPYAITHVSIWDASSAGNCLLEGALGATINAVAGDSVQFTAGQITATFT